jgi:hypothetical protein
MLSLPKVAEPLLSQFSVAFTKPTFRRAMVLFVGLVLTNGRHTLTRTLSTVRSLAGGGYFGSYHRVFSRARWSLWPLANVLAAVVLELVPADRPVICAVDDTGAQHRGKRVYGKGRHRDPLRSTRTHNVWVWGHQWVVLTVNVKFPFCARPWALPVLCALYRTKEVNEREGRAHKTPIVLARQLMAALMHWFPGRRFILLGDGHYASHELAGFCRAHRRRLTLVSLFHPKAHLCEPPPPRAKGQMGRRRIRGAKLPHPEDVVNGAKRQRSTVTWYGGKKRRVEFVSRTAHWYKPADGLVPVRWVYVHDLGGTHEDRYFYSTDPTLSASRIIGLYTGRWSIEVTFQEAKQQLGLATPRNRKDKSVLRTAPCLLGLYSVVGILFHRQHTRKTPRPCSFPWYTKSEVTFSDALTCVRRLLWEQTVFSEADQHGALKKLPRTLRQGLLDQLSRAA